LENPDFFLELLVNDALVSESTESVVLTPYQAFPHTPGKKTTVYGSEWSRNKICTFKDKGNTGVTGA
jgi:hypothetical protein